MSPEPDVERNSLGLTMLALATVVFLIRRTGSQLTERAHASIIDDPHTGSAIERSRCRRPSDIRD